MMMPNLNELLSLRDVVSPDAPTALYCRLSVDDANEGDSNSIAHQKEMLERYCRENGYTDYTFYVDDGYSGTTFERPAFKQMIADVEAGTIRRVIIKDLSRFGRDYLQVGMYTEVLFAQHDIHFIAIANNVDSQKGDNDLTPFVNLFNEWYARDCSRKQRAVARMKGMSGKRVASIAPYGYVKDKADFRFVHPGLRPHEDREGTDAPEPSHARHTGISASRRPPQLLSGRRVCMV